MKKIFLTLTLLTIAIATISCQQTTSPCQKITQQNQHLLAATPPMGWMTWNMFGGKISDQLIREMADALAQNGMKDAGYEYIIIDDLWQGQRDQNGRIQPDPKKFPNGMKALSDYVHSKGLKLGIYSDAAPKTCAGAIGSLGYEEIDAQTYADWGIDYLKYDYCNAPGDRETASKRYSAMANAIRKTGSPIVFAICEWGPRKPWLWAADAGGQLWRTTWDIRDRWESKTYDGAHTGIMNILDKHVGLEKYAGPGHWNDPDMLIVGLNGTGDASSYDGANGCTETEYRSNMSLWCLLAAPLIASNDLRDMDDTTLKILNNPEAIEVNQDPLGKQASRISKFGDREIWAKPMCDGSFAIGLLNRDNTNAQNIKINFQQLGFNGKCLVRDLWQHKDLGTFKNSFNTKVAPHQTVLLRIYPK